MENLVVKSTSVDPSFWQDKQVFLTGHTGFKGSWLTWWLTSMGAKVTGYALEPNTSPNLFNVLEIEKIIHQSHIGDVRILDPLQIAMTNARPEILIHMAAQPLVRHSYLHPVDTFATNVMGTVNVLEAARQIQSLRATVVVTTDKCYENHEHDLAYRETEPMGGYDPYSSSKGCAELVAAAYRQSFFSAKTYSSHQNAIATARAGNVIGGGDWSDDRLIPDAIKAFEANLPLMIRHPSATRPWQHVLEPLSGYLMLAQALYREGVTYASPWNFGPQDGDTRPVQEVINLLIDQWGNGATWLKEGSHHPHEANLLKLDCNKAHQELGWYPQWNLEEAILKIVDWHRAFQEKQNMQDITLAQIKKYISK